MELLINRGGSGKAGFTLIELMIVVAIIGILAAIAIPKFADLVRKSQEGNTRGNLGALRSALSIYYGDMEGEYPIDNLASLIPKYVKEIPVARTPPYHPHSNKIIVPSGGMMMGKEEILDTGGWAYENRRTANNWGNIWVNCTHLDSKGDVWTSY